MSISVNKVPPGFRFHPTEEELLTYYLAKKVASQSQRIDLDVIPDVDLNKLEPWDIQGRCRIGTGPHNDGYLFSHKDNKYRTGTRINRATAAGFWKATGRDKAIYDGSGRIGMRKTLVFYKGRTPHGYKSDWIMHEYRHSSPEDGWVICRVFKKKHQAGQGSIVAKLDGGAVVERSPSDCSSTVTTASDDALNHYMCRSTTRKLQETMPSFNSTPDQLSTNTTGATLYEKLPPLQHVVSGGLLPPTNPAEYCGGVAGNNIGADWDTLATSDLNGLSDGSNSAMSFFVDGTAFSGDGDLWSLARSVSSALHADLTTMNN